MAKLAVTGVTGKSGVFFWKHILENQDAIKERWSDGINLFSRSKEKLEELEKGTLPVFNYTGDLTDPKAIEKFCEGCDTLLHIAGIHWTLSLVNTAIRMNKGGG